MYENNNDYSFDDVLDYFKLEEIRLKYKLLKQDDICSRERTAHGLSRIPFNSDKDVTFELIISFLRLSQDYFFLSYDLMDIIIQIELAESIIE
jgi:hypothetical protein